LYFLAAGFVSLSSTMFIKQTWAKSRPGDPTGWSYRRKSQICLTRQWLLLPRNEKLFSALTFTPMKSFLVTDPR
jgi:hypothetical protein